MSPSRVPPEILDRYLPPERVPLRYRSRRYWLERADRLGPEVGRHIREIFAAEDALSQLRTVASDRHPSRAVSRRPRRL
jgi:hypothetical protein